MFPYVKLPKGNLTYASGFVKNISITAIDITKNDISFNDLLDIIRILLEYILSQKPSKFKDKMIFFVILISERIGNPVIGDVHFFLNFREFYFLKLEFDFYQFWRGRRGV